MKTIYIAVSLCALFLMTALVRAQAPTTRPVTATYTNPVAKNLPDPYVLRSDGMYYAYGTNAPGERMPCCGFADHCQLCR